MPELPEVQTVVNDLNQTVLNCRITDCIVHRGTVLCQPAEFFCQQIQNRQILNITRRGKFIVFELSGSLWLVAHLRMTGKFIVVPKAKQRQLHDRVVFLLDSTDKLIFHDVRCFGTLELLESLQQHQGILALGWDPWNPDLTADAFLKKIKHRQVSIKNILLDQSVIAGLGNIYASEILFAAGLDPQKLASRLNRPIAIRILTAMRCILEQALKCNGTSISDYRRVDDKKGEFQNFLQVYGKAGQHCPVCSGKIIKIIQNQRSTFLCPKCQKKS